MENKQEEKKKKKAEYQPPRLTIHGNLAALTKGVGHHTWPDGGEPKQTGWHSRV